MSNQNVSSIASFDDLPNELIFEIFKYLSYNDIIYTFFNCNKRINTILRQTNSFTYFEVLPTSFSSQSNLLTENVQAIKLTTDMISVSLTLFPNLKSIAVHPFDNTPEEHIEAIFASQQFENIHSLSIKSNEMLLPPTCPVRLDIQNFILKKVFNNQNHLRRFEYSSCIPLLTPDWRRNPNLRSLTLNLANFYDLNSILVYTPNLKHLNINTTPP